MKDTLREGSYRIECDQKRKTVVLVIRVPGDGCTHAEFSREQALELAAMINQGARLLAN